jgi:uncharacterized protein (TIGR02246 family)
MNDEALAQFAERYTAAWCSQNAASVAGFFASDGCLTINHGVASAGRTAITAAAQSFMTAFPDLVVKMDNLTVNGPLVMCYWTLNGSNTGPGATGRAVQISGYENGASRRTASSMNLKATLTRPRTKSSCNHHNCRSAAMPLSIVPCLRRNERMQVKSSACSCLFRQYAPFGSFR